MIGAAAQELIDIAKRNVNVAEEPVVVEPAEYPELANQRAAEMAECLEKSRGKDYLSNLPAEILNQIFAHLFKGGEVLVGGGRQGKRGELCQALLTSKALLQTFRPMYYREVVFCFKGEDAAGRFLAINSPADAERLKMIKHIKMLLPPPPPPPPGPPDEAYEADDENEVRGGAFD